MPLNLNDTSDALVIVKDGLVIPPFGITTARERPSGVLDADGQFVLQSQSWSNSTNPVNTAPSLTDESVVEHLAGRHIFAGIFYGHFGHFIVESLARLWALDAVEGAVDGLIFTPKQSRVTDHHVRHYQDMFSAFGVNVPVRIAQLPTRVDELIVPAQGFGMHDLIEGSAAFRDYINRHAGKSVPPEGAEKLYISRSKLPPFRGSILGEWKIEEYLAAEGYEIFHPQFATQNQQIAHYRAARKIVGADCSPLHLLGYVGDSGQSAGILTRRSMEIGSYLVRQLDAFKNMKVAEINCLVNDWLPQPGGRPSRSSWGEADFTQMHARLLEAGLITNPEPWTPLTQAERDSELERLSETHQTAFKPYRSETNDSCHAAV